MHYSLDRLSGWVYSLFMVNTEMTFEAFAVLYKATFAKMMSYSLKEVGSQVYVEKLAELAEAFPEWADAVEAEA